MKIQPIQKVSIDSIKGNEKNPRFIRDKEFKELVKSIKDFPKMMEARPIIVDEDGIILGGNMRYKAALELGYTDVHIVRITDATEEQKREFIIKDNVSKGEWDWDLLANEWDSELLTEWGMDVWKAPTDVDYGILEDGSEVDGVLGDMANGVKKAIQIEFEAEHYEEAFQLVKFWRERNAYIGGMIMEHLKNEKSKL